ncbi:MAG TPA: iron-containing alcohol dehydrogenase family protein [Streptosporangiaceae bacterium]|nr:iron-containing alcohol dehydrogenase family protein [Streptosporangiaceae bacterium]
MPVLTRMIPSPAVVDIRPGALNDLADLLADQRISNGRMAMAASSGSGTALREQLAPAIPGGDWYQVADGTIDAAVSLANMLRGKRYDALVALGGGRVIDVAKYAAARVGLPLVSVATNLSHDGICSPIATLNNDNGRGSYGVPSPIALVIDLDIVRQAPPRYIRAGIGEIISNISAIADWDLSHQHTGEPIDGLAAAMARSAGEAVLHHPGTIKEDEFLTTLAQSLVLTGVAMSISGDSRPSSGACHEISHAFDLLFPNRAAAHGEQCGLGAAFATHLRGMEDTAALLADALRRHKLPVLPCEIGFTDKEFVTVVQYAPQTRPGRYTILEHLNLEADAIEDALGDYTKAISN